MAQYNIYTNINLAMESSVAQHKPMVVCITNSTESPVEIPPKFLPEIVHVEITSDSEQYKLMKTKFPEWSASPVSVVQDDKVLESGIIETMDFFAPKCNLSVRLLDGTTIKHEFKACNNLNDVRTWLDSRELNIIPTTSIPSFARPDNLQPTNYAFQSPTLPRITYSDNQEFTSLKELELVPRSVLILKPVYNEVMDAYKPNKIRQITSTIGQFANALYSFFDYGVEIEDEIIEHQHQQHEHKSTKVLMIDSKVTPPTLINFEDTKKEHKLQESSVSSPLSSPLSSTDSLRSKEHRTLKQTSLTRIETIKDE